MPTVVTCIEKGVRMILYNAPPGDELENSNMLEVLGIDGEIKNILNEKEIRQVLSETLFPDELQKEALNDFLEDDSTNVKGTL